MAIAMSCMPNIHVNMHACTNSCKDSLTYVFASGKDKTHEFTDFVKFKALFPVICNFFIFKPKFKS